MPWSEYDTYGAIGLSIALPIFFYLTWNYDYWHRKKITHTPVITAVFGNTICVFKQEDTMASLCDRMYVKAPGKSMYGFYFMRTPALLVREMDLARMVLQTRASSFKAFGCPNDDLIKKSPIFTGDASWMSNVLTEKRLKLALKNLRKTCVDLNNFLDGKIDGNRNGVVEVELTNILSNFVGEVVTTVGLGTKNENLGPALKKIFAPGRLNGLKQAICLFAPKWARCLLLKLVPGSTEKQFKKLVERRAQNGPLPNDFLHWLMEENCSEIITQVFVFLLETYYFVSHTASFAAFHLSRDPDVQKKVVKEIKAVLRDGEIDYDNMEYLEQVIAETLRLNPLVGFISKECTEAVEFRGADDQSCTLKAGDLVFISTRGINLDDQLWQDPTVFDPDRHNRRKRTFYEGPKVAVDFSMTLTKMMLTTILLNYRLSSSGKTKIPLKISKRSYLNWPEDGLWVQIGRYRSSSRFN